MHSEEDIRILLVDDQALNRRMIQRMLKGYELACAPDGATALSMAAARPPDLVLMDVNMPGMDGYEVCHQLHSLPGCEEIPVIFLTGLDSDEAETRAFDAGGVDFINRPISRTVLLARVRTHLALRRALAEARQAQVQADQLLDVLLSHPVADELRMTGRVMPRALDDVTVIFTDLVGFTQWCGQHSPEEVVKSLYEVTLALETVAKTHGVQKLKTIGDGFMGAVGIHGDGSRGVEQAIQCGLAMIRALAPHPDQWSLRVGIHRGEVVAGVIGGERFQFDIFGDTVNIAARLCDVSLPDAVCISRELLDPARLPEGVQWKEEETHLKGAGSLTVAHISASAER